MPLPVSTHAHHLSRHHQSLVLTNHSSLRLRRSRACEPTLIGAPPGVLAASLWRLRGSCSVMAQCPVFNATGKRRNRLVGWIGNGDCMRVLCYIALLGFSQFCWLVFDFVELFLFFIVFVCLSLTSCLSCAFSLLPPLSDWYRMTCLLYFSSLERFG
jgi:hypothetical protein